MRPMPDRRIALGSWGERLAAEHLRRRGYDVLETNYRCPRGEIDIVARDGQSLVFVEVRTRRSSSHGTPQESITTAKQRKLVEVAQTYLQEREVGEVSWRIDVVAVGFEHGQPTIYLIRNAVSA